MIRRILVLLCALAGLRASAQHRNDVTVWSVGSFVDSTVIHDNLGTSLGLSYDEKPGFGLSLNRYWTEQFSTELSYMTFRGNLNLGSASNDGESKFGELEARTITGMAQWHFRPGMRVQPYLSGGIAHVTGDFDPVIGILSIDRPMVHLQSNVTWTAAAGLDINLTDHWALSFEGKRVPWNGVGRSLDYDEDAIDLDPMLWGSGVRFRF